MNVLWLKSDYIDPPDTGGKIRTYNLLRELGKSCNVTYVSLNNSPRQQEETNGVSWATRIKSVFRPEERKAGFGFYGRILARMVSPKPYIVQKYLSNEIRDYQQQLFPTASGVPQWDGETVVICDFLEMTGNVVWSLPGPKILFQHNVESVIWQRYHENETNRLKKSYFWFEAQRLKRYESNVCNRFDLVLAVSSKDKEVLQQQLGVTVPIEVIETGVDVEFFTPPSDASPSVGRLLFLGSLDWMPNIDGLLWFAEEIYPRVKESYPHVALDVVGRRPTRAIEALAEVDSSIRVYADVPDVRPYLASADVFVVPLRIGSGTRLKIFEAMAMRRAVVSTVVGAEGLPVQDGKHLMLADSATHFAEMVNLMLSDAALKQFVANEGYDLVRQDYSWQNVSRKLHGACLRLCQQRRTLQAGSPI